LNDPEEIVRGIDSCVIEFSDDSVFWFFHLHSINVQRNPSFGGFGINYTLNGYVLQPGSITSVPYGNE
jgi:hypothetical protein